MGHFNPRHRGVDEDNSWQGWENHAGCQLMPTGILIPSRYEFSIDSRKCILYHTSTSSGPCHLGKPKEDRDVGVCTHCSSALSSNERNSK